MNVQINAVNFNADKKLEEFAKQRVNKLVHFYDDIISSEVFLRVEKTTEVENKFAEIRLVIRGYDLFAKKQSKTFEEAIDLACEALRTQIKKHKEKIRGK
jgi:putative sigma-54 modulation protein